MKHPGHTYGGFVPTIWEWGMTAHQLYAKFSKCEFWIMEDAFLGHVISTGGVSVDPGKVEDVLNWMPPTNVSKI
jgi:hypothetical protein